MKRYYVYIMASMSRTLYIGMTSNLQARVYQHKSKVFDGFTSRYNVTRLVYVEEFAHVDDTIARERQLKGWARGKKIRLIEAGNPGWDDLSVGWVENVEDPASR